MKQISSKLLGILFFPTDHPSCTDQIGFETKQGNHPIDDLEVSEWEKFN